MRAFGTKGEAMTTLWVHGRKIAETWELQGIYDEQQKAIDACQTEFDFIGPVELNTALPTVTTTWPGCYYPTSVS